MRLLRRTMLCLSVLALILLCGALFILKAGEKPENTSILSESGFVIDREKTEQNIRVIPVQERNYLFLPCFSDSVSFRFRAHRCEIDGEAYFPGARLDVTKLGGTRTVCFFDEKGTELERDSLEVVVSGALPAVFISSATGSYALQTDKLHKEYCTVEIVNPDGRDEYLNIHPYSDIIRGHGNSTWTEQAKKSYNLYLQFPADLFGMGQAKEWVMLANAMDLTGMRNKLVYDYAGDIGLEFSPKSEFVDVFFDGKYHGTYLFCEKTQTGEHRVDIGNDGILFTMETGSRLSGKDSEHITKRGQRLVRLSPEPNSGAWVQRFSEAADSFEELVYSDFTLTELEEYADIESWAKMGIIEELFSDFDAWTTSQYFYIKPDSSRIYAGPVWDFDYSAGNTTGLTSTEKSNMVNLLGYNCDVNYLAEETPWFYGLMKNSEFYDYVRAVFEREIYPGFEKYVEQAVEEYFSRLHLSRHMDALRWALPENSPEEYMKKFLSDRLDFLKRIWIDCEPFYSVTYQDTGVSLAFFENEECSADLYGFRWFFDAGFHEPARPFVPERDTLLYSDSELLFHRLQ